MRRRGLSARRSGQDSRRGCRRGRPCDPFEGARPARAPTFCVPAGAPSDGLRRFDAGTAGGLNGRGLRARPWASLRSDRGGVGMLSVTRGCDGRGRNPDSVTGQRHRIRRRRWCSGRSGRRRRGGGGLQVVAGSGTVLGSRAPRAAQPPRGGVRPERALSTHRFDELAKSDVDRPWARSMTQ